MVLGTESDQPAAEGLWFAGRPTEGIRPWADLVVRDPSVLLEVARAVGPGGSVMVAYEGDDTERALRRKVPPQATPLGIVLLRAGCRWFKDWYYPEGGREGGTKLQGTLPLDEDRRRKAERALSEELQAFLKADRGTTEDRSRATEALDLLRPDED